MLTEQRLCHESGLFRERLLRWRKKQKKRQKDKAKNLEILKLEKKDLIAGRQLWMAPSEGLICELGIGTGSPWLTRNYKHTLLTAVAQLF